MKDYNIEQMNKEEYNIAVMNTLFFIIGVFSFIVGLVGLYTTIVDFNYDILRLTVVFLGLRIMLLLYSTRVVRMRR